jgi:hypothetical protein
MANYRDSSNYSTTKINRKYLDVYNPKLTLDTLSQETKKIRIGNRYNRRPDLLAYDLYGNSRYWWIFVHYNREVIEDPINDFVAGKVIVVPSKQVATGVS